MKYQHHVCWMPWTAVNLLESFSTCNYGWCENSLYSCSMLLCYDIVWYMNNQYNCRYLHLKSDSSIAFLRFLPVVGYSDTLWKGFTEHQIRALIFYLQQNMAMTVGTFPVQWHSWRIYVIIMIFLVLVFSSNSVLCCFESRTEPWCFEEELWRAKQQGCIIKTNTWHCI